MAVTFAANTIQPSQKLSESVREQNIKQKEKNILFNKFLRKRETNNQFSSEIC
jgi:hypothetical protein